MVTITRTNWIDDDGTGTTGTVINNAEKTLLYNQIDAALAQLLPLAGGTIGGTLNIGGLLGVFGGGQSNFQAGVSGGQTLAVRNTLAGGGNFAGLYVGNDSGSTVAQILAYSSVYAGGASGFNAPDSGSFAGSGAGGLTILASHGAGSIRFYTGGLGERMRIEPSGIVAVSTTAGPTLNGQLSVAYDGAIRNGIALQQANGGTTYNYLMAFYYLSSVIGSIAQASATSVMYNTTSDQRLKTDRGRATDLSALRAIEIHDFDWIADGHRDRGVFAQEAIKVFPRAIAEGDDETTADGTLARPWMTDYSKFVPDLIVGFREHDAAIAALREQLATLKGSN